MQRAGLDLTNPFPRHGKTLPDLLESVSVAVLQSEPHLDDLFLAKAQSLQDRCRALLQVVVDNDLSRKRDGTIFDEVAEVGILVLTNGCIQRNGYLRNLQSLLDLIG